MIIFDACSLREVYSSDRHLVAAAPHFGLRPVTL